MPDQSLDRTPLDRKLHLVCWDPDVEPARRRFLETAGFAVDPVKVESSKIITHIRLTQPDTVVFDLDRRLSHSRAVAVVLRTTKSTQRIPLVFLYSKALEEAQTKKLLIDIPDAQHGLWTRAVQIIKKARPGQAPVVPLMKSHPHTPLEKKLGITAETAVIAAPESFSLPNSPITRQTKLTIWFIRSLAELRREIDFIALHPPLWIAFPKQSGRFKSDFTQHDVRALAGAAGLVDNKVCAIDSDWSTIRFARRKLQ